MSNLDLYLECKIITDIARDRDNNCGYIPIPMDKVVVEGNTISIVGIVPPDTLYQLRIRKESQDQWNYQKIWKSDSDGVARLAF